MTDIEIDVDAYLARIGFTEPVTLDLSGLAALQLAHLRTVPFENIDIVRNVPVRTDLAHSLDKIVTQRRGGWCFEANGAFGALLEALGFRVSRLGAAVLLGGPNAVIDHLTLEVELDVPHLVDVGFGDSFTRPLELNRTGAQDGGSGVFEFMASSQGTTMTRHDDDGIPVPQFRFKRVTRDLSDFDGASDRMQSDPDLHWSQKPFATRLLEQGADRVTLLTDRLKVVRSGNVSETPVAADDWDAVLAEWFDMTAGHSSIQRPSR